MARLHHKNEYCYGVSVIFKQHKFAYSLQKCTSENRINGGRNRAIALNTVFKLSLNSFMTYW